MRISTFLSILLVLVTSESAVSQDDLTRGFQLGIHGGLTSWDIGDIEGNAFDSESGINFGGSVGWGMSDWLGIFARGDFTTISPEDLEGYTVGHLDIGIRGIPQLFGSTVRPYFEVLASVRDMSLIEPNGFEISASGVGFGGGLGLYFFVSGKFAVNAGFTAATGNFDTVSFAGFPVSNDVSATSGRLIAGVTFFP